MILFTWSLTTNQIQCLRSVASHQVAEEGGDRDAPLCGGNSFFISGIQRLMKKNYITKREVAVRPADRVKWAGATRPKWEVTSKGRLMLELVEIELREGQQHLAITSRELKRLKAS